MSQIRILIVEDEWIVSEEIRLLLEKHGYDVVGQAEDDVRTLEILKNHQVDVVLMDINIIGRMDGIQLADEVLKKYECAVIFLTAYADDEFLNRAKKVKPAAFIVKPFEERNLHAAIELAFDNLMSSGKARAQNGYKIKDSIFIKTNTRFKKIPLKAIHFAEANGSYTKVFTDDGIITLAINLKHFEGHLDDPQFMRIHRSFVVNLKKIEEYEGNCIYINQKSIPISSSHKDEFLQRFTFI